MWEVITTGVFDVWYNEQSEELQDDILAALKILGEYGPQLGRPYVDTLYGSKFPNMKELRIQHAGSPVRALFAFDPYRNAIVLCAGDKTGLNEKRFYKDMIKLADAEFKKHLEELRTKN
ncbi:addiction module toxin RelE [Photorhabdus luminescens]|uniref:Addiction module toxin RelE n=2 Tax=Photorhabdus luminescens TaxID=29488 RepID=A0A4R4IUB5_PHOLU|nr:type II toxin-antitoxin system RelE/ParE family toxin [Photorhabdus luminescens]OWO80697.1 addiction module toxin RelE [Photorhabdus luminescens]TDB44182.1 addiction module toxin RelE [Photorhabdus luminescens subsp. mexicana]